MLHRTEASCQETTLVDKEDKAGMVRTAGIEWSAMVSKRMR